MFSKYRWIPGMVLLTLFFSMTASADVVVPASWAGGPPSIDGVISAGEWTGGTATNLAHVKMRTLNDTSYLYILLDVVDDTIAEPVPHDPSFNGDFFAFAIDADRNGTVTPNVDLTYSTCQDGRTFVKSYYLSAFSFTGCQNTDAQSLGVEGFDATFNSATPHRFWEFRLKFAEIGVDPSTWASSGGLTARVRINVGVNSGMPSFLDAEPSPSLYPNLTNTYRIDLALGPATPVYPPGTDGPTFAGVGLVPSTFIDAVSGYANINIPNYYYAKDAPFGGRLNIFGHWNTLAGMPGAKKYRVLYSKDGGPFVRLLTTFTNFKFTGGAWVPQSIGPDADDAYKIPDPAEIWYLTNLLVSWQSDAHPNGTYELRLQILNNGGGVVGSPASNSLRLFIDNTAPFVKLNQIYYDDGNPATSDAACACAIVTQGDAPHGFKFNITVTDANGALNAWSLGALFGDNESTGAVASDNYLANISSDGPNRWDGDANILVPASPFRVSKSCAYTWVLSASSRVQNGYGLVFPYVQYHQSLTTLLGAGAGSITSCTP